jgi:polyphosphate kinase
LLERVKLFAIVSSNLDEFIAVRMARLEQMVASGNRHRSPDGRTPETTLVEARRAILALQTVQEQVWLSQLQPGLAAERIHLVSIDECSPLELQLLGERFHSELKPLLLPLAGQSPFRDIPSLTLNVALRVRDASTAERRLVCVVVPDCLPRFLEVGSDDVRIPLEDVVLHFLPAILGPSHVEAGAVFRITRDANLAIEGDAADVVDAVEAALRRRRVGTVVRLETRLGASAAIVSDLRRALDVPEDRCYESAAPLALRSVLELADADRPELKNPQWNPVTHGAFACGDSDAMLTAIRRGDLLVHHPYASFDSSVLAFVCSARDSRVEALKATVYRTGDASTTLAALVQAAESGKDAVALVEVKARFDERRNIDSGRSLERAGVDVVYGVPGVKVHAKLTLLVRRERSGIRRYVHIGTGNYHASNAYSYEDLSLFTADEDIAADVVEVFDVIAGRTRSPVFRKLLVGPWFLRRGLLAEIERVTRAAAAGQTGRIRIKVNSLVDPDLIEALYSASQAGARVEVVARGICALRPGVPGVSDGITVRSVLGRFLEHSRILSFRADDRTTFWIGSPDLMPRNLDQRIEVLVPVEDEQLQGELEGVFDALLGDTASSWELDANGVWHRTRPRLGDPPVSAQETLMARASVR